MIKIYHNKAGSFCATKKPSTACDAGPYRKCARSVSRVLSRTVIHLGPPLPTASSNLPAIPPYYVSGGSPSKDGCLVLLPMGFALPHLSPDARWALTRTVSPLPNPSDNEWAVGGLFSVALSVPVISGIQPGPGCYPAWHPLKLGLSSPHPQAGATVRPRTVFQRAL